MLKSISGETSHHERRGSQNHYLVVFNALGRPSNLVLVEYARRNIFPSHTWDCVAFMFAPEYMIPDSNVHLRTLIDELGCTIPRTPGIFWGHFLQYLLPTFTSKYDYIAIVLDDIFMPDRGENAVNATKLIESMQKFDIDVITPAILGDTYNSIALSQSKRLENCIVERRFIETFVQIFSSHAWECFYKMLHHEGGRGWCYDFCFKKKCPHLRLGQDLSMKGWHMDRKITSLPIEELGGTFLDWKLQKDTFAEITHNYYSSERFTICERYQCRLDDVEVNTYMEAISCPELNSLNSRKGGLKL